MKLSEIFEYLHKVKQGVDIALHMKRLEDETRQSKAIGCRPLFLNIPKVIDKANRLIPCPSGNPISHDPRKKFTRVNGVTRLYKLARLSSKI